MTHDVIGSNGICRHPESTVTHSQGSPPPMLVHPDETTGPQDEVPVPLLVQFPGVGAGGDGQGYPHPTLDA